MSSVSARYRGRFAPSPTGPLHFGSLIAAVGSRCEALVRGGQWMVRIEDLDRPREVRGAADAILRALERHGFAWDGPVLRQSARGDAYRDALERLRSQDAVFPCGCTRREVTDSPDPGATDAVYPGTCRDGLPHGRPARAWRVRASGVRIVLDDAVMGRFEQDVGREVGDFVVLRADGLFAYQLAVVVDDALQCITDVVRGADLLGSTPRQVLLQRLLGLPATGYAHLPLAVDSRGAKLSKQTLAAPIEAARAPASLVAALEFLGQSPPPELAGATPAGVWAWAAAHWDLARVPRRRTVPVAH